jgi:hypothetical protein
MANVLVASGIISEVASPSCTAAWPTSHNGAVNGYPNAGRIGTPRRTKPRAGATTARGIKRSDMEFNGDGQLNVGGHDRNSSSSGIGENQMTKLKTISAVVILSAAVATPVFAQPTHHAHVRHFRGAYNQMIGPSYYAVPSSQSERNIENFGFSGRDRSRPGGWDPNLNPPS